MSHKRISDILKDKELVGEIRQWLSHPVAKIVFDAVEPLCRPSPLKFPVSDGEAEYQHGLASGAFAILDLIRRIPDLSLQVSSQGGPAQEPDYNATEILKKEHGYQNAPAKR